MKRVLKIGGAVTRIWLTLLKSRLRKRPWCCERLRAGGEGGGRGWDGWLALLTQWTWVWANSGRQWRAVKPGMLQSMRLQSQTRLSDWATKNNNSVYANKRLCLLVIQSSSLFLTAWIVARQAPLPMEFSRREYWSGQPLPSSGDLPNPWIKPRSPTWQTDYLIYEPPGKPVVLVNFMLCVFWNDF